MRPTQGASALVPGQPGTRRHRRLGYLAQRVSPTLDAVERGYFVGMDGVAYKMKADAGFFGPPSERIDPGEAVMEELARSRGFIRDLEAQVRSLQEQELVWEKISQVDETRSGGQGGDYHLVREEIRSESSVWWNMLERERRHYATVAASAVRSGLEERRVRLAERSVDVLEAAVVAALQDAGYDPHDSSIRQALGLRLQQAIESGQVIDGGLASAGRTTEPVVVSAERLGGETVLAPVDF